jgi:hypothetical protein
MSDPKIIAFSPKIKDPITRNDRITIRCNSIQIQNAGNVVVRIDDEWTIYPGGILQIGSHTDHNLIVHELHIAFINDPLDTWKDVDEVGAVKRVEIIENHIHDRITSHYSQTDGRP